MSKKLNGGKGKGTGNNGLDMKALVNEAAAAQTIVETTTLETSAPEAEVQVEAQATLEVIEEVVEQVTEETNNEVTVEVIEVAPPVIEEVITPETEDQPEAGKVTEVIEVDPTTAQLEALKAMAVGTPYEGLVNDIGLYISEHAAITSSADDVLANEKNPDKLHEALVKRSEGMKAIGTRIRSTFSDLTQKCIGVNGSIADKAVQQRKTLYEVQREAKVVTETTPATK